jgi:polyphosphate kinase
MPIAVNHSDLLAQLVPGEEEGSYLNPELSLLEFQKRVLALAEEPSIPQFERLRFLAIVSANLDEFYMVRVAALKSRMPVQLDEQAEEGTDKIQQLIRIVAMVNEIVRRAGAAYHECASQLPVHGLKISRWADLDDAQKRTLRAACEDDLKPELTPLAMTLSPGHPLPHLAHMSLSLAVVFRANAEDRPHLAQLELPCSQGRFLKVPGTEYDVIPVEEVVRGNLDMVYRDAMVSEAYVFRVTRGGELNLDEASTDDLLEAVAVATVNRYANPAIRLEVERGMPPFVRELLLESMRRDSAIGELLVSPVETQEVEGLLDLRCLNELVLPPDPTLTFPPLKAEDPFPGSGSMFDLMRERDLLLHHPFQSFDASVVRFIREAADDHAVTVIKITLYRVGSPSAIVDALLDATKAGKRVVAFVELKARFDEDQNVTWAKALEAAGANVVYGMVGLKNHAKVSLVVRRENGKLQSYVHVGTGNYNARSGRQYTDLSLFSARPELCADVSDLFNGLTGSSLPPRGLERGALTAPHQLLPALIERIERETANARAGKAASIRAKLNGLSDPDIVDALYEASSAGVKIDLVVRGICTLRPGVRGVSENIRVKSILGRFLEHSRIYRFENAGAPEYFIGSSDMRPRNLRRRVELLIPILDKSSRKTLDEILDRYMSDECAWNLQSTGAYVQHASGASRAQDYFAGKVL